MASKLRQLTVGLLIMGSTLLLLGASPAVEPQAPPLPGPFSSKVVWTPDGKHIIFSRGFQGIYRVDVAGSELQSIPADAPMGTPFSPGYALPALSPDGARLAFVARLGSQSAAIMVSALDGTGARRLTQGARFNTHPAWSPDGQEIAYIADGKLAAMRVDGTVTRALAPLVGAMEAAPVWSPDGDRIAFVGFQQDSAYRAVYTVRPDGTGLTELGATVSVPSWSPDGSRLAFLMPEDDGEVSLYTFGSVGANPQRVWALGRTNVRQAWSLVKTGRWFQNLAWSPDGSAILYVSNDGEVEVASLDHANELPRFYSRGTYGRSWNEEHPGGILARVSGKWAAWSPSGSRIAVLSSLYQDSRGDTARVQELYSIARDGALKRVLAQREGGRPVAQHPGWFDTARNIAACSDGIVPDPEENAGLVQDCQTLMMIRDKLSGSFLLNWSPEVPINDWWGVKLLEYPPYRVGILSLRGTDRYLPVVIADKEPSGFEQGLDLGIEGLTGIIPPELGNLTGLYMLSLSHNRFRGGVPPDLSKLKELQVLEIANSGLTGSIPPELGDLTNLDWLDLSDNDLSGSIPPEMGNLTSLGLLYLNNNSLGGEIPPELGKLTRLGILRIADNRLSGRIPRELGNLTGLGRLDLSNNDLTGNIPPELGNLSGLRVLVLHGNNLEGCVPAAFADSSTGVLTDGLEYCTE